MSENLLSARRTEDSPAGSHRRETVPLQHLRSGLHLSRELQGASEASRQGRHAHEPVARGYAGCDAKDLGRFSTSDVTEMVIRVVLINTQAYNHYGFRKYAGR